MLSRSGGPLAAAMLMLLPAVSLASSGGGGVSPSGSSAGGTTSNAQVQTVGRETASGDGITVSALASSVFSWRTRFSGTAPARDAGKTIELQRTAKPGSSSWVAAAEAPIEPGGSFTVKWRANRAGKLAFRAVLLASPTAASASAASPSLRVTVYHLSRASWYGPGFFGHRTACGKILRRSTLGVANRTLKCGTRVSIMYHGHTIRVPVIDRGPYVRGTYWDLTEATARALGMTETSRVGTLFP